MGKSLELKHMVACILHAVACLKCLAANFDRQSLSSITGYFRSDKRILKIKEKSLQTHHADSTLKRRGNGRFHVASTWNLRGVFVGV